MDEFRYVMAALLIIFIPPAISYWFLVHPFIHIWRRLGVKTTYLILIAICSFIVYGMVSIHQSLLQIDFGTHWVLIGVAVIFISLGIYLQIKTKSKLKFLILVGVPELKGQSSNSQLITDGIYAYTRNPRYLSAMVGLLGWTLFANFLATYILYGLTVHGMYGVLLLEEKELRERYGAEYEEYCKRVPRFFPCWKETL